MTASDQRQDSLIRQLQGALAGLTIRTGIVTCTWAGASAFSDTPAPLHGLGHAPVVVLLTPSNALSAGGKFAIVAAFSYAATTFSLQAVTDDRTVPGAGVTVPVAWVAIG